MHESSEGGGALTPAPCVTPAQGSRPSRARSRPGPPLSRHPGRPPARGAPFSMTAGARTAWRRGHPRVRAAVLCCGSGSGSGSFVVVGCVRPCARARGERGPPPRPPHPCPGAPPHAIPISSGAQRFGASFLPPSRRACGPVPPADQGSDPQGRVPYRTLAVLSGRRGAARPLTDGRACAPRPRRRAEQIAIPCLLLLPPL